MTGFQTALFGIRDAVIDEDAAPYCGLADILQNNVVSQKNVVRVAYDRQAVRTLQI